MDFIDPLGLTQTCTGQMTFTGVGGSQAGGVGALGVKPPNGSLAINPKNFGFAYDTTPEREAAQREIRNEMSNINVHVPKLNQDLTIGDVGDSNIRNSPVPRADIYRFKTKRDAINFGRQTLGVIITNVPDNWSLSSFTCQSDAAP